MNARTIIGFDTVSKAQAQAELDAQTPNAPQMQMNVQGDAEKLKMETIQRLSQLGDLICNVGFSQYPPMQRQQILLDFAYYSKVADSIL